MSKKTIRTLEKLYEDGHVVEAELSALKNVTDTFSFAISEDMYALIDQEDRNDPIKKQFIPSVQELTVSDAERADPIGDTVHQTVKGVIHRYPDRCLFLPVQVCPVYCRFCFRRENVGSKENTLTESEREAAFSYIESHPAIWEVIITGGDPLILKPTLLKTIVQRLNQIPHVEVIRFHTRVPIVEPHRITDELLQALTSDNAIFVAVHANHAKEFSGAAQQALSRLVMAGIPLLSQTTLLNGINDNIDALSELMRAFVRNRIKPYYLHHADLAKGTGHFRTSIATGQQLMRQLRGRFSGLCQPTYMLDIPGGYGKVPILPCYLHGESAVGCYQVEDYSGEIHTYRDDEGQV